MPLSIVLNSMKCQVNTESGQNCDIAKKIFYLIWHWSFVTIIGHKFITPTLEIVYYFRENTIGIKKISHQILLALLEVDSNAGLLVLVDGVNDLAGVGPRAVSHLHRLRSGGETCRNNPSLPVLWSNPE